MVLFCCFWSKELEELPKSKTDKRAIILQAWNLVLSTLYISNVKTDKPAKVARDRSVPSEELRGPKDALHVFPLKYSLYATTSLWAGSFVWGIRKVFWRRSRQSELWGGKNFSRRLNRVALEALALGYFFGLVCAARDSKLAPRFLYSVLESL